MKPEELSRYERMYRAIEELMGTKLLRFSFPVEKGSDDLADREAKSDRSGRSAGEASDRL